MASDQSAVGRWIGIGTLVLVGFVLIFGAFSMINGGTGMAQVEEHSGRFTLASGETISVVGRNGEIRFERWQEEDVLIEAVVRVRALTPGTATWISDRITVDIERSADGVRATSRGQPPWMLGNVSVRFFIRVPEDWSGRVSLHTDNGPISAEGLNGQAELRTSNGRVKVAKGLGRIDIHTSNGAIEVESVDAVLRARTSNGAVQVRDSVLRESGFVRSSNGPIGFQVALQDDADYELRTSNGRIDIDLIDPDVSLDLTTSNGEIRLHTEVLTAQAGRGNLVGRIGEGMARLHARTSNGAINLSQK